MSTLRVDIEKRLAGSGKDFSLDLDFRTDTLTTVIFGPSGAGKTTLLRAVAGLLNPDRGLITFGDRIFFDSDRGVALPPYQRRLGMVFQQPALFPHMTALANVLYAAPEPNFQQAHELLERFHVSHAAGRRPVQLSGGEQQRVAIARALAARPRLLLLDEPLPGVDSATRASVLSDLVGYQKEYQVPYLYVTHNRVEALRLDGRALLIDQGRLVAEGKASQVLSSPGSNQAARILGRDNVFTGTITSQQPQEGLTRIDLGGVLVTAAHTPLPEGAPVAVTVPSVDIVLSADPVGRTSARNVFSGRVIQLMEIDGAAEALVETPIPFRVHLTRSAVVSLQIGPGSEVQILMKAAAVIVEPL